MQEKILQQCANENQQQDDMIPLQTIDNLPAPQISVETSISRDTLEGKSSAFHQPMTMYMPPYPVDQTHEPRQQTNHSMMYLMAPIPTNNRPKTPPSMTFLTPSRGGSGSIMTAYQTPTLGQNMTKRPLHHKASPSDGESDKSCEEDEIDVVNDLKSSDSCRDTDSSMSTNNTSSLESPSTVSSNSSSPASNSTNSPQSTDSSIKKKVRTNYSPSQVQALEKIFHENPYPEPETMEKLASDLEIAEAKIKVWFQNKRARWRRRAQENPHPAYMASMSPMMSPMASYGMVPHHHPMLHGSPAQVVPSPFFYPGHPVGTPVHHTTPGYHFSTPGQSVPMTPGSNTSPASSTSSTSSPSNTENQNQQSPHGQITTPYQHRLPHFSPYMPFSYQYGVCPPYYC